MHFKYSYCIGQGPNSHQSRIWLSSKHTPSSNTGWDLEASNKNIKHVLNKNWPPWPILGPLPFTITNEIKPIILHKPLFSWNPIFKHSKPNKKHSDTCLIFKNLVWHLFCWKPVNFQEVILCLVLFLFFNK